MTSRVQKIPGTDHPIALEKSGKRMRVVFRGLVIAESDDTLVMREATYAPVYYFPRADVKMDLLGRTAHNSWCPYKGEACYFSIDDGDSPVENAIWSYETPFDAVANIRERLAFYPNKVDRIEEA